MKEDFEVTVQDASESKVVSTTRPQVPALTPASVDQQDAKKPQKKGGD